MWGNAFSLEITNLIAMIPLTLFSIVVVAIALERLFNFRPGSLFDSELADKVVEKISNGEKTEALALVAGKNTLQELILHDGMSDCFEKNVLPEVAFLDHGLSKLEVLSKRCVRSARSFGARVCFGLSALTLSISSARASTEEE